MLERLRAVAADEIPRNHRRGTGWLERDKSHCPHSYIKSVPPLPVKKILTIASEGASGDSRCGNLGVAQCGQKLLDG
jgi:hypothetical protein